MSERHQLSARYGASFYDSEALWTHLYGTDEDKRRLFERRKEQWTKRLIAEVESKLRRLGYE